MIKAGLRIFLKSIGLIILGFIICLGLGLKRHDSGGPDNAVFGDEVGGCEDNCGYS